jgi:hypothetical protein
MNLRIRFAVDDLFVETTGALLAVDRVFVRCPRPPAAGSEIFLRLYVAGLQGAEQLFAKVLSSAPSEAGPGFEAELPGVQQPSQAAPPPQPGPLRVRVRIASAGEFALRQAAGLGAGVLIVPMAAPPLVGTHVELTLELPDRGPPALCDAVVRRSTPAGAGVTGQAEIKCLGSGTPFHRRVRDCAEWLAREDLQR